MTTRKEELKKEIEYLKERCLGVGVNVLKAELKGIQEGKAEAYKKCLEILDLHNIKIKEAKLRVKEYLGAGCTALKFIDKLAGEKLK